MIVKRSFLVNRQAIDPRKNEMIHHLLLAWAIILGGCLVSLWNWYYLGYAEGNYRYAYNNCFIGWSQSFFVQQPGAIVLGSVRWLTCFMRAVGTILAGLFLSRIRHKQAVCVAFGCIMLSFPLLIVAFPFQGNTLTLVDVVDSDDISVFNSHDQPSATTGSLAGYFLFTFFRSFLFVGAGILVVCTQPILSELRKLTKIRSSRWNSIAFYSGFILATFIFIIGSSLNYLLVKYWYVFSFLLISLVACLLLAYLIFGKDLKDESVSITVYQRKINHSLITIKDPSTWSLAFLLGFLTFLILFPSSSAMRGMIQSSFANLAIDSGTKILLGDWQLSISDVWRLWQIFFVLGGVIGYFLISPFSQTNYERRGFLIFTTMVGFMFLSISIVFGYNGYSYPLRLWLHFLFIFLSGIFLWGTESIVLTIPHELEQNHAQQVSSRIGLMLGVASLLYMIADCSFSLFGDLTFIHPCANICGVYTRSISVFIFATFLSSIFFVLFFLWMLPKTGVHVGDNFYYYKRPWRIWNWNFTTANFQVIDRSSLHSI